MRNIQSSRLFRRFVASGENCEPSRGSIPRSKPTPDQALTANHPWRAVLSASSKGISRWKKPAESSFGGDAEEPVNMRGELFERTSRRFSFFRGTNHRVVLQGKTDRAMETLPDVTWARARARAHTRKKRSAARCTFPRCKNAASETCRCFLASRENCFGAATARWIDAFSARRKIIPLSRRKRRRWENSRVRPQLIAIHR